MDNGLGLHNLQWRKLSDEEVTLILNLKGKLTGILVLAYPDSPVLKEKAQQDAWLWNALDRPRFLLRIYAPDIPLRNATAWARICIDVVKIYQELDIPVELIGWNEWNIEGGYEDWMSMQLWIDRWVDVVISEIPEVPRHLAALSPQTPHYQQGMTVLATTAKKFHEVNLHTYTKEQADDIALAHLLYKKPICITEYNKLKPTEMRSLCPVQVTGHYYYIAGGDEQDISLHLLDKPDLVEDFKKAPSIEVVGDLDTNPEPTDNGGEGTMSIIEQYADLFEQWEAAGGIENNFRSHLIGVGVIRPSAADLVLLVQEATATLAQLTNALATYPL